MQKKKSNIIPGLPLIFFVPLYSLRLQTGFKKQNKKVTRRSFLLRVLCAVSSEGRNKLPAGGLRMSTIFKLMFDCRRDTSEDLRGLYLSVCFQDPSRPDFKG